MKSRKLGPIEVSELGFGCMNLSANYHAPAPKEQGIKTIRTEAAPNACRKLLKRREAGREVQGHLIGRSRQRSITAASARVFARTAMQRLSSCGRTRR
jgi:hypothetical protein